MSAAAFHERILSWVLDRAESRSGTLLLGLNGPQGAGKSTLSALLCERLAGLGKRACAVSIDDFYLTREEQVSLASGGNPYLQSRGYPGTHDIALGEKVLRELLLPEAGRATVPRYDKSAHGGKGDRAPPASWTRVERPLDVLILEGWMLGFPPAPESALPNEAFREINHLLAGYDRWHRLLHAFLQLVPSDHHHVLSWRVEAEERMKASGRPGMSEAEIRAYVETFLPAYATYLPALEARPPVPREELLRVRIGLDRLPSHAL